MGGSTTDRGQLLGARSATLSCVDDPGVGRLGEGHGTVPVAFGRTAGVALARQGACASR
jgi:hypothetical protein